MNDYYDQGWNAYEAGMSYNDCPFETGTTQEYDWQQGFLHAESHHQG